MGLIQAGAARRWVVRHVVKDWKWGTDSGEGQASCRNEDACGRQEENAVAEQRSPGALSLLGRGRWKRRQCRMAGGEGQFRAV